MMPTTVYIVQDSPGKNLLPAKKFGDLKILLTGSDIRRGPEFISKKLKIQLKDIRPQDSVLLIGDPIAIGLAMHIALHNTHGIVKVLRWDRRSYEYEQLNAEAAL
jgi:hypothetical protein